VAYGENKNPKNPILKTKQQARINSLPARMHLFCACIIIIAKTTEAAERSKSKSFKPNNKKVQTNKLMISWYGERSLDLVTNAVKFD
jgi:hypothetical protein